MKKTLRLIGIIALAAVIGLTMTTCDDGADGDIPVTFISLSANGSSSQTTTQLTLTFSQVISGLTADDISLMSGGRSVNKGTLSGSGPTYTLPIGGFAIGGTLSVSVAKSGYEISGSPKSTDIYYYSGGGSSAITYTVTQTGGADGVTDTAGIIFTFSASVDSLNLTAADITIGGTASKGQSGLSGTGATRTLVITVNSAGTATVTIAKTGIVAETKHITVYKAGKSAPTLAGITAVYSGTAAIYPTTPLNNLKADLTVKAQSSDGGEYTLSENEYTLDGTLTVGTSTITVSYTEGVTKTTTFTVTVAPVKTLTGITLDTTSVKKDYDQNEQLDLSGLVVTAAYNDSTIVAVTNYTTSPADGETLSTTGAITVTVSYTEGTITKTADFTVSVNPNHIHQWGAWTQITAATETTDGEETRTCTIDPTHKETRIIAYATGTSGLAFELIDDNTAYRVRKGTVDSGEVHIPAYHRPNANSEYLPVTEIGSADDNYSRQGAFSDSGITVVHIPNTVTLIGGLAFYNCRSLTSINIPDSVTSIHSYAFNLDYSTSLTSITIPASVTTMGDGLFWYWSSSQVINILGYASEEAADTAWQKYPYWSLGSWRSYCGATIIYGTYNETAMLSFTLINNNTAYSVSKGPVIGGAVVIPASYNGVPVTEIGYDAFRDCTGLTGITIPASVTSIGDGAFSDCTSLTGITIPAGVTSIGNYAFGNCTSLTEITIPASVTSIGSVSDSSIVNGAFSGCINLATITFAEGSQLQTIGDYAFRYCTLTSVTIPDSVTSIGGGAFDNCTGLTSVTIPEGVTTIGVGTFYNCTGLTSITIPESVTSIGGSAFHFCSSLTSITIPASVTEIGGEAFSADPWNIMNLQTVTFAAGSQLETIGYRAFYMCASLTGITIPSSVTSIGESAFNRCSSLTSITIPAGVTSIGSGAFGFCTSLTSVTFEGPIPASGFQRGFDYDLSTKFYATDSANGTPGTYTVTGNGDSKVWTRQP